MSRDKKDLDYKLTEAYEMACAEYKKRHPNDPQPFLTCTYRTNEEQESLYAIGRTVKGKIVTNARGGQSPHNYNPSLAFDIGFITIDKKLSWDSKYFSQFAECIKQVSSVIDWGGDWTFRDAPHFELKNWKQNI